MAKIRLTKKTIDGLVICPFCAEELKIKGQVFLWDETLSGFGLKLTPNKKSYVVQARVNGRTRRETIGPHGVFHPEAARAEAQDRLQKMRKGIDPQETRARTKAAGLTLGELAAEYKAHRPHLKPLTLRDIDRHVNRIFKAWKDKPITEISRDKIRKLFLQESKRAPTGTNQAFRILRAMLNFARATYRPDDKPILPENPCQVLSDAKLWNPSRARNSKIPIEKAGQAWAYLQHLRAWPGFSDAERTGADLTAFIMLSGCRLNEGAALQWQAVDLDAGTWHLSDPKNRRPVTFPMSRQARAIVESRPRINDFVFCGLGGRGHISEIRLAMKRTSEEIGLKVTAHDLRRGFVAIAAKVGVELWKTKLLLNHKLSGDVTLTNYMETADLEYLRADLQRIADFIATPPHQAGDDKVIDFATRRQAK